jgi:hypothetical protein
MQNEIDKCEMRCTRCHAIKTHANSNNINLRPNSNKTIAMKYMIDQKLLIGKCQMCNWFDKENLYALQFDHIENLKFQIYHTL